jgi:hypothetical protein
MKKNHPYLLICSAIFLTTVVVLLATQTWKKNEIQNLKKQITDLNANIDLLNEQLNFATNDTRIMFYHCKATGGTLNGVICECPPELGYNENTGRCEFPLNP